MIELLPRNPNTSLSSAAWPPFRSAASRRAVDPFCDPEVDVRPYSGDPSADAGVPPSRRPQRHSSWDASWASRFQRRVRRARRRRPLPQEATVILEEVQEFLTGDRRGEPDRVLATVLLTDIVGSTDLPPGWVTGPGATCLRAIMRSSAGTEQYRGREVATAGDGFLATFDGPARAVPVAVFAKPCLRSDSRCGPDCIRANSRPPETRRRNCRAHGCAHRCGSTAGRGPGLQYRQGSRVRVRTPVRGSRHA